MTMLLFTRLQPQSRRSRRYPTLLSGSVKPLTAEEISETERVARRIWLAEARRADKARRRIDNKKKFSTHQSTT